MHSGFMRAAGWTVRLSALQDLQIAGLIMGVPMSFVYTVAALCFAMAWLRSTDRTRAVVYGGQPPPKQSARATWGGSRSNAIAVVGCAKARFSDEPRRQDLVRVVRTRYRRDGNTNNVRTGLRPFAHPTPRGICRRSAQARNG